MTPKFDVNTNRERWLTDLDRIMHHLTILFPPKHSLRIYKNRQREDFLLLDHIAIDTEDQFSSIIVLEKSIKIQSHRNRTIDAYRIDHPEYRYILITDAEPLQFEDNAPVLLELLKQLDLTLKQSSPFDIHLRHFLECCFVTQDLVSIFLRQDIEALLSIYSQSLQIGLALLDKEKRIISSSFPPSDGLYQIQQCFENTPNATDGVHSPFLRSIKCRESRFYLLTDYGEEHYKIFLHYHFDRLLKYLCELIEHDSLMDQMQWAYEKRIFDAFLEGHINPFSSAGQGADQEFQSFVIIVSFTKLKDHGFSRIHEEHIQVQKSLDRIFNKYGFESIQKWEENALFSCLTSDKTVKNNRYDNLPNDIMKEILLLYPSCLISSGRVYQGIEEIKKSYSEAKEGIAILKEYYIHRNVINYRDVGILRLLLPLEKEDLNAYLEDILASVIAYDEKRNTSLFQTLFYYSRFNKDVNYVSKKLFIHPNTLYQRIKKAEELMGYDISDPMDWFDIQAASILYGLLHTNYILNL